jgi:hypothetical protein
VSKTERWKIVDFVDFEIGCVFIGMAFLNFFAAGQEIGGVLNDTKLGWLGIRDWRGLNRRIEWPVTRPPLSLPVWGKRVCHHTPESDPRARLADQRRFDLMTEMAMAMHHR